VPGHQFLVGLGKSEVVGVGQLQRLCQTLRLERIAFGVGGEGEPPPQPLPFVADDSIVTRVEGSIPQGNVAPPSLGINPGGSGKILSFEEMSMGQIIVVAGGLVFVALVASVIISGLSQSESSSNSTNSVTGYRASNTANSSSANANRAANTFNASTALNTAATPYGSSSNTSTSNSSSNASNSSKPRIVEAGATFCEGYEFGWKETFTSKGLDPPRTPPCPDPKKYRESGRDGFGGQVAGTLDAMERINGKK